ncbi:MAG: TIGR04551 family protein [Myxococcales bacterium]|nr:TIGR04551 family protein [Myxococcales bacterium]
MRLHQAAIALAAALWMAAPASADDAPDEQPLTVTPAAWRELRLTLDGYLRVRGEVWNNLDLSRGPTPSTGEPLFPVAAGGGNEHTLTAADMRVRLEPTLSVGQAVRLHLRVDLLDNVGWGSTPDVLPSNSFALATRSAESPEGGFNAAHDAVRVKRAWGEVVLPFGVLSAGRMGAQVSWGTGFFVNNGDCLACDSGDSGDRVALTVPLLGHLVTALYELSASGPYASPPPGQGGQNIDLERRAHVDSFALAVARYDSPEAQRRRLRAGRTLVQYGLLASYRMQELDAPAWTQPGGLGRPYGAKDFVRRGLSSYAVDLWVLVHHKGFRAELEAATVIGKIEDATDVAGVSLRQRITSAQFGGVASLAYAFGFPLRLRLEVGCASGDDAPGFGARVAPGQLTAQKGDLDGPQLRPPTDTTLDNFRFHPDYRIDLILWRRIVGQVTDAVYVKPSLRAGPFGSPHHNVTLDLSLIDSHALFAATPPGQDQALGVELDLAARYRYEPAFEVSVGWGLLFPGAGFRNLDLRLDAKPAQALEVVLMYRI